MYGFVHHEFFCELLLNGRPCSCGVGQEIRLRPSRVLILCYSDGRIEVRGNSEELSIQIIDVPDGGISNLPAEEQAEEEIVCETILTKLVRWGWERLLDIDKVLVVHVPVCCPLKQEQARRNVSLIRFVKRLASQLRDYKSGNHGSRSGD